LDGDLQDRPISVEPDVSLREECVYELTSGTQATTVAEMIRLFLAWFEGYENSHIEFEKGGETVRTALENSYQQDYGNRYYAKLKGWEREITRRYQNPTTVILTFTASHENANGGPRCPGDHMRDIADGFDTARKTLHQVLSDEDWEYAKAWEPHKDGYGHMHVGIVVDAEISAAEFKPVMESYKGAVKSAGSKAHSLEKAVSVNDDIENLGSYISEYIGWDEALAERPREEVAFLATTWATNTRRVEFSGGAQEMIREDLKRQRREEAGATPEDRGGDEDDDAPGWTATQVVIVDDGERHGGEPGGGGVRTRRIDGRPGADPEKFVP
jgi:hypothetical protein